MKKTVKTAGVKKHKVKTTGKKTVKTVKTPKKRAKKSGSDAMRAVMLTGILIVLSAVISVVVIRYYKSEIPPVEFESGPARETRNEPVISVSVRPDQQPEQQHIAPEAKSEPVSVKKNSAAPPVSAKSTASASSKTKPPSANSSSAVTQRPPEKAVEKTGTVVFVIDDAGNNLRELEPFLRIPGPLTIAVLPGLANSAEAARRIRAAGKEVFLHQPMEAIGGQNPGPGAIYSGMSAGEIRAILKRNVEEIGPVAGMNNHQGSKITMDKTAVDTILAFCAENGLCFLDSRTTAETVVPSSARRLGIKIGERDVFLDNEQDKESMLKYITSGLEKARKNGNAVMIGHTWSPALAPVLAGQFPKFIEQGYTIKTASDIIKSK
ncbi:MAG: divergent polysaccharide deacetylase family protein [Treponema sp.]|jgi:polysaccharide deacetylase 2 family uncharacterized protein YibQ|nr:divergent polysaccharide deacetylase family protein [Treponema sp.]